MNYFFGDQQERSRARRVLQERGDVIVSSSLDNNLEINGAGSNQGGSNPSAGQDIWACVGNRLWDLVMVKTI